MAAAPRAAALKELAAQRPTAPASYQVRSRDTLTTIAARLYGHANRWPALWWVNRHRVANPDALRIGTTLRLSSWHPDRAWIYRAALAAVPKPPPPPSASNVSRETSSVSSTAAPAAQPAPAPASAGIYSYGQIEALWVSAGGPASAEAAAASIAECESGGNPAAYNPSGASGLWQILGAVVPGNLFDPMTNARNAVAKFMASGGTFGQWVCTAAKTAGPVTHFAGAGVAFGTAMARHRFVPLRVLAFWQALRYRGDWYAWGGTGPSVFDCSGLVYRSYLNLGRALPRTTFAMLGGGYHLHYTPHPRKGMLAFYGSGHVELYVRPGVTYGAHHSGTRVGYTHYSSYYHPTMFMWVSRR
jgi:cell wall-associated NlpC family hydrolase